MGDDVLPRSTGARGDPGMVPRHWFAAISGGAFLRWREERLLSPAAAALHPFLPAPSRRTRPVPLPQALLYRRPRAVVHRTRITATGMPVPSYTPPNCVTVI